MQYPPDSPVTLCQGQAKAYPGATYTRQCRRAARLVAFVPDDNGDAIRHDVRGFIRHFCGLHDPARAAAKRQPFVKEPTRKVTLGGREVNITPTRASEAVRLLMKGARTGLLASDCNGLFLRWQYEDNEAAAQQPAPATIDAVRDLFG